MKINLQKIVGNLSDKQIIVHEWNGHLEIFSRPQVIENSRQYLLLRTDILQKTVVGCPWLLAVFMEALQECCNYILFRFVGSLHNLDTAILSSKQRGAYFLVFSDSFASLFSIHGQLISSSAIVLSSLCKLIILACKFSLLWLECSQHKLWHIPISFSALVFVHWFQLVRKAKTQGQPRSQGLSSSRPRDPGNEVDTRGVVSIRPSFLSSSKKRFFSTELCRARYLVGAKAEQLESMCDVVLGICHTFCIWLIPFFSGDTPSLEGAFWYNSCAPAMVLGSADLQAASHAKQLLSKSLSFRLVATSFSFPIDFFRALFL